VTSTSSINPDSRQSEQDRDPVEPADDTTRKLSVGRVLGVIVVLSFVVMWIYIFANTGRYKPVAYLEDRRFPEAAQPICATTEEALATLPRAQDARTATERSVVIDQATDLLVQMQTDLRAVVPVGGEREKFIRQWIDDWSIYLQDRRDYAAGLRKDSQAEFLVTPKYGAQLSKSMDNFADTNRMESCATPGDV